MRDFLYFHSVKSNQEEDFMKQLIVSFFLFCLAGFQLSAQTMIPPMDIPLFLSGNFGELRSNHFHSGIDFKTRGVTGIPIKAVKDGYISRINISPWGYGRALYVTHYDGTKSVYGHLDHFVEPIETFARDSQYIKEKFHIELYLQPSQLPVKQGEIIAYSGNTGGSGGPHLHFEIRDAVTDEIYDPLPYYKHLIKDNVAPEIQGLMIFPQPGVGVVNGGTQNQEIKFTKDKSGKRILTPRISVWGDIGIGVKAYDKMTGTANIYLPKKISLEVDGVEVFSQSMDRFLFSESRYINSLISFDDWFNKKSFFMKSYIEPGNQLNIYTHSGSGIISVKEERVYQCKYTLSDIYGNQTVLPFEFIGEKQVVPERIINGELVPYNKRKYFLQSNVLLEIPAGNLYTDIDFKYEEIPDYTSFSPLFQLGKRTPLHAYCPLMMRIVNDSFPDKSKYGIIHVVGTKKSWQGGTYKDGYLSGEIRELGNYSIDVDTIAPKITPVTPEKWTKSGRITFKVTDDLSGVVEYKGTLDGQFVLFEYDPKTARMFCVFDSQRMKRGKQHLLFKVKDRCGNENEYSREVSL